MNYRTKSYKNALKKLLPPVSYNRNGANLDIELQAEANSLDGVNFSANAVLGAITPFNANNMLADWERVLGIPSDITMLYQLRLELVLQKLAGMGGLSIAYFIGLATSMGYIITIIEGAGDIFRAGRNRASDRISSAESMWLWRVNVRSVAQKVYYFRAGLSRTSDRLRIYTDPVIEAVFNDLKPAFTLCVFSYTE